ncbi:hypothetical protein B0J14DRAFT_635258 [Halenospora varia]|nr:hypothetical protein B0J14DRAFT_635258 [Halenospora varia]
MASSSSRTADITPSDGHGDFAECNDEVPFLKPDTLSEKRQRHKFGSHRPFLHFCTAILFVAVGCFLLGFVIAICLYAGLDDHSCAVQLSSFCKSPSMHLPRIKHVSRLGSNIREVLPNYSASRDNNDNFSSSKHIQKQFDGSFSSVHKFEGPPSIERDRAWSEISNYHGISLRDSDMIRLGKPPTAARFPQSHGGAYVGELEVFHQLHCLAMKFCAMNWITASTY